MTPIVRPIIGEKELQYVKTVSRKEIEGVNLKFISPKNADIVFDSFELKILREKMVKKEKI